MFNQKTKNGIRIVKYLADNKRLKDKFSAIEIAKGLELNSPFVSKILQELTGKNIISSSKGRGGGFFLSPKNNKKTIIDLVNVFEDYGKINDCILGLKECSVKNPCMLHFAYQDFKIEINNYFKEKIESISNTKIPI